MNPLVLYFASGESLYPGAVLLALTLLASRYRQRRWLIWLRRVSMWIALAMIVMACPPSNWVFDTAFTIAFLLWLIASNRPAETRVLALLQIVTTSGLLVLLLMLSSVELFYRRMPVIRGPSSDRLVVIGDSISSGLDSRARPWPTVMQQTTGVDVKNLSKPGAMMADGLRLIQGVSPRDNLILIELGGNDLLEGETSEVFAGALDTVLARLAAPGRTIVMFELPLLPQEVAYGRVQRRLAAKYGVVLIPKRCLATIIAGRDATSDGLHLTDVGSRGMASLVANVLSPVLKPQSNATTPATHP